MNLSVFKKHIVPLFLTILLLAGCAPIQEAYQRLRGNVPVSTATPETRRLTVYSALSEEQVDIYRRYFEQAHPGIQLDIQTGSSWELVRQLIAQRDNPGRCVVGISAPWCARRGCLAPTSQSPPRPRRLGQVMEHARCNAAHWIGQ
jgi:ABC-type molybdate transport system substrate-binding protein